MSAGVRRRPWPALPPGAVVGVVGGGQLGRMLALAAARLGFDVAVLGREADAPALRVAAHRVVGAYDDPAAVRALAAVSDVLTYEFESVDADLIAALEAEGARVAPGALALRVSQDRLLEKRFLTEHGLTVAPFAPVDAPAQAAAALAQLGAPAVLKTRREGYDGKGQAWVHTAEEAQAAAERLGPDLVMESRAPFVRELSVIAARAADGAMAVFPVGENTHEGGVLRTTVAPAEVTPALQAEALRIASTLAEALGYVGVLGVELFDLGDGRLWVNEFAPRVHNSGHWTQDGCAADQFEQHIRACVGWPLAPVQVLGPTRMTNLLGGEAHDWPALAGDGAARLHLYGKRAADPGRKMGHVNRRLG